MSLRGEAHLDLIEIMNDEETGGDLCTITSPAGAFHVFRVFGNDIHLAIDPGTGQYVTGRQSSISVLISELLAVGFEVIRGIADKDSRPWVVDTVDVNGIPGKFKVSESNPDNGAGLNTLFLELYESE
jgi:hypothetical protein